MEKIASFQINHLTLLPGLYVSRVDKIGLGPVQSPREHLNAQEETKGTITTFDIRITAPNREDVMGTAEAHAIEHLGATYLRNHPEAKDEVLYFGPMGCRTGFYLLMAGALTPKDIFPLMDGMFSFIEAFEGEIPGASPSECGNFKDMDLERAKQFARKYRREVLTQFSQGWTVYPA